MEGTPGDREEEPEIKLIDGVEVEKYLTPDLKDQFIRQLVTANDGGKFNQGYFDDYMRLFQSRVDSGKITLLLSDGAPAAIGGIDVVGDYFGRQLFEIGNLVVLSEFQGQGFASCLIEHSFRKILSRWPGNPILARTHELKIAQKFLKLGMRDHPVVVEIKIRNPRSKYPGLKDHEYESLMGRYADQVMSDGSKNYFFDPTEQKKGS